MVELTSLDRSRSAKRVARRAESLSCVVRPYRRTSIRRNGGAEANAISPPKPAKARPEVGARVKVLTENEDKEGLYYDDDRAPRQRCSFEASPASLCLLVTHCECVHGFSDVVSSCGSYFQVGTKGMVGRIIEDDTSEQPFRVKLKNGKLSWFKEAWLEDYPHPSNSQPRA